MWLFPRLFPLTYFLSFIIFCSFSRTHAEYAQYRCDKCNVTGRLICNCTDRNFCGFGSPCSLYRLSLSQLGAQAKAEWEFGPLVNMYSIDTVDCIFQPLMMVAFIKIVI